MKKLDFNIDPFADIRKLCPECIFTPKYPYSFKFDLVLDNRNYGDLEIIVKEELNIAELRGANEALKKLDEMTKKAEGKKWRPPPPIKSRKVAYPLKQIDDLGVVLGVMNDFQTGFKPNGDFEKMVEFISNFYTPIDTELLYKKTGISIIF